MRNHLVIGLGGTGGLVIRSLRKRVFQEHRSNDILGLGVEYLYIDSSGELMDPEDPTWKILGTSVQLPCRNQLRVTGTNLQEIISDLSRNYPGIHHWLGSPDLWKLVPADVIREGYGQQSRRLGRFLFALKVQEFRSRIATLVKVAGERTQTTGTTFHVVTGLAGGTGSGAMIDVIAQISDFSTDSDDSLVLYAVLPDKVPERNWDAGNYHANGYAALIELNGLMIRRYHPWDILRGTRELKVGDKLKGAYLITNENENGITVNVEHELPHIVADFLYEVIVESTEARQPAGGMLENFSGDPECVPGTEEPVRARKFTSFGIKRVAVPEEEITEYLTLNFARQAILQLYYNNWDDRFGFRDETPPRNYASLVSDKDAQTRWLVTDEHLTLQTPILPEDVETAKAKKWQPSIDAEWMTIAAWIQPECAHLEWDIRLNELHMRFEGIFSRGYRGRGAPDFYKVATAGRQKMARHIVRGIERELFEKWQDGTYSASEIGELLTSLRTALEERKRTLESWRTNLNDEIQACNDALVSIRDEWAALSFITRPLKSRGLFEQYGNTCRDLFRCMTEAMAFEFALGLIPQILDAIAELKDSVNQVTAKFAAGLEDFKKKLDARVDEKSARNFRDAIVKYYDPQIVKTVVERLITNRAEQFQQTALVRKALIDDRRLGGELTFERFRERVAAIDLLDVLERICMAQARMVHDKLVQSERERILGVQLITRLRDEFGGSDEKLSEFARNIILPAKTFVRFDQVQVVVDLASVGAPMVGGGAQKAILVKRPCPEDLKDFVGRLDRALTQTDPSVSPPQENHGRPHELSVLSFVGNFPLRYLEILPFLRDKYRSLVDGSGGPLAKLELHTDDVAFVLPDLYQETGAPRDSLPYLLLAEQLEIIQEVKDPLTGETLVVGRTGKGARQQTLRLGEKMEKLMEELEHANFLLIKSEVDRRLEADYLHKRDKQQLQNNLETNLENIKASLKGGGLNPEFEKYRVATVRAETLLGLAPSGPRSLKPERTMPTMQPRVEIVLGDMFEGPSDLIVLPCSTGGTVTGFVEERLSAFKLPRPHSGMELGQVEFKLLKGVEQLASFVAFAASVKAFTSNLDAIERIGSHLGKFATQTPGAMQIAAPLLGAGAGGLRSEDVVEHLVRGFSQAAPARVVLKIFVRHRNVYNRLQDMLPRLQELTTLPVNDVDSFLPHVRALISYTRTTEAHKAWVKDLAVFLRENGIDARLDEWHLPLGSDVAQWMCNEVELADRVLMICNEEYARRADGRHGGVGWEIRMIQGFLLQEGATNPKKFIPVVRTSDCNLGLPIFLKSAYFLHWPEENTDEPHLRRKLLEALYEIQDQAPRLGRPPSFVIEALRKQPSDRATRTPT